MYRTVTLFSALSALNVVFGQQVGTYTAEVHPTLSWSKCTTSGGCTTQAGSVVIDANWRWVHQTSSYTNCYTGNTWDATICPDGTTCAENCALEGADYSGTYGITTSGNALTLKFMTTSTQTNIGSRVYLMASDSAYQIFKPNNQEISFDVDVSNLPCGLNGAVYFSEMSADGGMSAYPNNKAGAKYGTGYCDSQCPRDIKFINGMVSIFSLYRSPPPNSSLSYYRPTLPAGLRLPTTSTRELVTTEPAAARWISGRPTRSQLPTPPILAVLRARPSAPVTTVDILAGTVVCATPMAATSTLTAWATPASTDPARPSTPARSSPS